MNERVTRRYFIKGLGLLSATAALAACSTPKESASQEPARSSASSPMLAIIHTNDSHGHDVEVKSTEDKSGNFSMAAVPKLRADWEAKGYDVLVLDAGDATQGMPLVDQSRGQEAMTLMNACGYDLMTIGNHEFDRGGDQIKAFQEQADFPIISANILLKETGKKRFESSKIFELTEGTKVGVFGLTTPSTMTTSSPDLTKDFAFLSGDDLIACAREQVKDLRSKGCDLVICLAHLGNEQACEPDTSRIVLEKVDGIDLFIDGHDHLLVNEEVNGTLLVETGCYFANIGLIVIDSGAPENESMPYGSYEGIDQGAQAVIDRTNDQVQKELGVVLGHTNFTLGSDKNTMRSQESNLGDFTCDAMLWGAEQSVGTKPDAALLNSGTLRDTIPEGDISLMTIKTVMPFADQLMLVDVTGAQLLEAIEAACQSVGDESAIGAFPQVSGITYTVNSKVPYQKGDVYPDSIFHRPAALGERVTITSVGERAWNADDTYTIVTTDYICLGGDTYYTFKEAADAKTPITCDFDYEAISGYLVGPCDHEIPARYEQPQGYITII